MADTQSPQFVGDRPVPIIGNCTVGRSEMGYVMLNLPGVALYAIPVDVARELAKALVKNADLIAIGAPLSKS